MSYLTIIRIGLGVVNWFMKRAGKKAQQQIGADRVIKSNLVNILVQVREGKRIDATAKKLGI